MCEERQAREASAGEAGPDSKHSSSTCRNARVCVTLGIKGNQGLEQGDGNTSGISRPTKRMPAGADAVGDAPLCTCSTI